ncbi:hypothetical protein BUH_0014 [Burkholderia pseudomallei Pakistan 9]|nr:hypothetical protein BUH_0014 [Burkholderia pseudomallei Pakistan 9]
MPKGGAVWRDVVAYPVRPEAIRRNARRMGMGGHGPARRVFGYRRQALE